MSKFEAYVFSDIPRFVAIGGSIPALVLNFIPMDGVIRVSLMLFFLVIQLTHLAMLIYAVRNA